VLGGISEQEREDEVFIDYITLIHITITSFAHHVRPTSSRRGGRPLMASGLVTWQPLKHIFIIINLIVEALKELNSFNFTPLPDSGLGLDP